MATIPVFPSYRVSELNSIISPTLDALFTVAEPDVLSPTGYTSYKIRSGDFVNLLSYWNSVEDAPGVYRLVPKNNHGIRVEEDTILNGLLNFGANEFTSVITSSVPASAEDRVIPTQGYVLELTENARKYLGYFVDETALTTAYPTANVGDYATVGSTDTMWVWDDGTSAWVDTHNTSILLWQRIGTELSPVNAGDSVVLDNNVSYSGKTTLGAVRSMLTLNLSNDVVLGSWSGISGLSIYAGGGNTEVKFTPVSTTFNWGYKDRDFIIRRLTAGDALWYDSALDLFTAHSPIQNDLIVNDMTVGKGGGNINTNEVLGYQALSANTTGTHQTALGFQTLLNVTTNANNTAVGYSSGKYTTGGWNSFMGQLAGAGVSGSATGGYNTGMGNQSLLSYSSGSWNSAFGADALRNIGAGNYNTAVGFKAGAGLSTVTPSHRSVMI